MSYVYTICGAEFDSIKSVKEAYGQLSYKGRRNVVLTALSWASPCNELVAECIATSEDGICVSDSCGSMLVTSVLSRMIIWMEFRGMKRVGDNILGVHIPFDYDQEQEQD